MTTLHRVDYTGTLTLLTPLHLGSGEERIEDLPGDDGACRRIALILRDHEKKPHIPATSLKGVLRRLEPNDKLRNLLFGQHEGDDPRMGALLVRGARLMQGGRAIGAAAGDRHGVYLSTRTAIDAGRGVVLPNHLFTQELLGPGATFALRLRLECCAEKPDFKRLDDALQAILSKLMSQDGVGLGADGADGGGRLKLEGNVTRRRFTTSKPTGRFRLDPGAQTTIAWSPAAPPSADHRLVLTCRDPYLSVDDTYRSPAGQADEDKVHLMALRDGGVPWISASALSGALRARMNWLLQLDALRQKHSVDPDGMVERLFGSDLINSKADSGSRKRRKGVVSLRVHPAKREQDCRFSSIRIDRFSGGVIENALYTTDADTGTVFEAELTLDARGTEQDRAALDRLVADLCENGLMLGHGSSRGFGWFTVAKAATPEVVPVPPAAEPEPARPPQGRPHTRGRRHRR